MKTYPILPVAVALSAASAIPSPSPGRAAMSARSRAVARAMDRRTVAGSVNMGRVYHRGPAGRVRATRRLQRALRVASEVRRLLDLGAFEGVRVVAPRGFLDLPEGGSST